VTKSPLGRVAGEWGDEVVRYFDFHFWQVSQNQCFPENEREGRYS